MFNQSKRIVITGIGAITPSGNNVLDSWNGLLSCKSNITSDGTLNIIDDIDPRMGKFAHLCMIATDEAILDSELQECHLSNASIIIGSGIGGLAEIQDNTSKLHAKNYINLHGNSYRGHRSALSPFSILETLINLSAGNISIKYGVKGLNQSVVSACASGAHAIIDGIRMIKLEESECVIVGGTEACVCPVSLWGFHAMKALYAGSLDLKYASMPFDTQRAGFIMSEGAGTLILEEYEHAKKRNAKIYAEIIGYGFSSDASHITKPNMNGAIRSMKMALGNHIRNICINAHATSTPAGDESELNAIYDIFGEHEVYITANKGVMGHTLGAAGAIEAIFSVLSLQNNIIPGTANLKNSINNKTNVIISNQNISNDAIQYVLSNSFGFGGTNASLLFGRI